MRRLVSITLISAVVLSACAPSLSNNAYERRQARTAQVVELGVVEHVRVVQIEGTKSGVGAAAGGVIGGVAGQQAGHSQIAMTVGGVAGGVLGGVAGAAAEEGV